ncbi:MAG TPA: hypothetical protein PKB11_12760, partial [Desulfovibrio sp.]|nr:hypothetical protein [Desulfovibrio sp.]
MLRHKAQASPVSWTNRAGKALPTILLSLGLVALWAAPALAQQAPSLTMQLSAGQAEPGKISVLLEILFLLTILSVAPAIVLTMTSFTRII